MGVVSKITKRVEVPGEPGQWVEIRMVSWLTLDASKKERLKTLIEMRDVVQLFRETVANGTGATIAAAKEAAAKNPLQDHDQLTLLRHGVVSWSYGDKVDVENFDTPTAEWAAKQILAYTLPGEAEVKTPSSLSTGT